MVYAIGDVHGRRDLLDPLLEALIKDAADLPVHERLIILLGDMIDRGPHSREIIDGLVGWGRPSGVSLLALRGNHEDSALQFLEHPLTGEAWFAHGGAETLRSYGVAVPNRRMNEEDWYAMRSSFLCALPPAHLTFLKDLPLMAIHGDYAFVHAGVRPGIELKSQAAPDLLWIRDEFLRYREPLSKVIVHGHSIMDAPQQVEGVRISLDTGAYASGALTAVRLMGSERKFFQARVRRGLTVGVQVLETATPL